MTSPTSSFLSTGQVPTFNIGGLASGLDTNSIISQLMAIERQPQDRIVQQQTLEQTRLADLQAIQTQLGTLATAAQALSDPSTWTTSQTITSSQPSAVTASGSNVPPGGYQVMVTQLARAAQLTQSTSLQSANNNDTLTIQVGANASFNVAVKQGDSLQTIANDINAAGGTQVYASIVNNQLVLSGQVTGSANTISVTSTGGGTLAADLGLTQTVAPLDAKYSTDGGTTTLTSSSNTVTSIATGLTVNFVGLTSGSATINVAASSPNTSGVQSALQAFVTAYNQTVDMISAKVNEARVPNPQNDADRAKGDLNGDPALVGLLGQLREAVSDVVSGAPSGMNTLSEAGLSTGAAVGTGTLNQSSINGDLTLDTTTLSSALSSQFANVKALFTNQTGTYASEGLYQRINGILTTYTGPNGVLPSEITGENSLITELASQKADWDVRLADKEQSLRQQFTNMETAMQQAQVQGNWLAGQISGLGTGH